MNHLKQLSLVVAILFLSLLTSTTATKKVEPRPSEATVVDSKNTSELMAEVIK